MTKLTMRFVLLVLCIALASAADNPCTTYSELPRAVYRGGQCNLVDGKETCDTSLEDSWYRAVGLNNIDLEIQTDVAVFSTCGTRFPYWMNGSHPTVAEQEVDRTVCRTDVTTNCGSELNIKVKNCTGFYVYKLKPTPACPMAYCFGKDEPCPPFDPCDVFEHYKLDFDPGRSAICGNISNACDSFDENRWYKFETSTGYLNVSSTCPKVTNACGSPLSIWINGTTSLSNGTNQHVACVKDDASCCSSNRTLLSRQCKRFRVFNFGNLPKSPCQRVCTENVVDVCPVEPTMAPTMDPTAATTVNDTQNDRNYAVKNGEGRMMLYNLCCVLVVLLMAIL